MKIAPWHPIKMLGGWDFPINYIQPTFQSCDAIITFVLPDNHVTIITMFHVLLGHNCTNGVLNHQYFGTSKVIDDLETITRWKMVYYNK